MSDPIAYFITWTTYGTWLPGDQRGWVKRGEWKMQPPDAHIEAEARQLMTEGDVVLTDEQRGIVDATVVEHCRRRNWTLHARNVRTNHVHVVVTAVGIEPEIIREQLKSWCSRALSDHAGISGSGKNGRRRWWTEKGDIEWIRTPARLAEVIEYVLNQQ